MWNIELATFSTVGGLIVTTCAFHLIALGFWSCWQWVNVLHLRKCCLACMGAVWAILISLSIECYLCVHPNLLVSACKYGGPEEAPQATIGKGRCAPLVKMLCTYKLCTEWASPQKYTFLGQSLSVFSPFLLHINPFTSCFIWVVPSILVICMSDLWEPEGPLNPIPWNYGLVQSGLLLVFHD